MWGGGLVEVERVVVGLLLPPTARRRPRQLHTQHTQRNKHKGRTNKGTMMHVLFNGICVEHIYLYLTLFSNIYLTHLLYFRTFSSIYIYFNLPWPLCPPRVVSGPPQSPHGSSRILAVGPLHSAPPAPRSPTEKAAPAKRSFSFFTPHISHRCGYETF